MDYDRLKTELLAAYDQYADAIFRYCLFKTSQREVAEDISQQVFLKAWVYIRQGQAVGYWRAFLYRLANNLVIDWYRQKKNLSLDQLAATGLELSTERGNPEQAAEIGQLFKHLQRLAPAERDLIIWRYVEELTPLEISEILQVSANIVSVRLHRALGKLRTIINH